jgi:very-short-patch-repair endonuclease
MTMERIAFARSLRRQPTRAEDILWRRLRGSRFHRAKFKRQVLLDRTVVDFHCRAAKLAVEIDGDHALGLRSRAVRSAPPQDARSPRRVGLAGPSATRLRC